MRRRRIGTPPARRTGVLWLLCASAAAALPACGTSGDTNGTTPSDDAGGAITPDAGVSPPPPSHDGGVLPPPPPADASTTLDASAPPPDATTPDATTPPPEAGAPDAGPVDTEWKGRPPAAPLIVRDPYLSTWSAGDAPNSVWPTFWTGGVKGMAGIARIDGAAYAFLGVPSGFTAMGFVSQSLTPTKTRFVFSAGGVRLTVDFLSPVEPDSLKRQSAPLGYITASASSSDGGSHAVSLYFDISGEWAHGDSAQSVTWARESVPHTGGSLIAQTITPATPTVLGESSDAADWGTAFLAADGASNVTAEIGADTVVRSYAAANGKLDGTIDKNMPRAINAQWPVLGFSFDLGSVTASPSAPATLVVGHAREPGVSYLGAPVPPLWKSYWPSWETMVADAYDDGPAAAARAATLDARIVSDAKAAGGDNYAALCDLGLRQAFGGTQLVGTTSDPWLMLKEISSDGNVSTVDVVYPASPVFLYTNPYLLRLMLQPLLAYAESGLWPQVFAEHDLGSSYPNASGHNDGGGENMQIEETANMLIMMAAYVQRAKPADAQAYATAHYKVAKQWADYLVPNTLDPQCQNQTDDFTGSICHSVNLALKGIVGVGAMSIFAKAAGNAADQASYLSQAQTLIGQWATKSQDSSGKHLLLEYDVQGQWSLKYNAFYDRALGLNLVPAAIIQEETSWYASQATPFGVLLDPRNSYNKTDWALWAAAAIDDPSVRRIFIDSVYNYATTSTARVPFGDLYCVVTGHNSSDSSQCTAGQWKAFEARPVQGGVFTLLARQGTSIVSP